MLQTRLCCSRLLRSQVVFTDDIQSNIIADADGRLEIKVHRGLQGGRRWRGQVGAFDVPTTSEAPPLLDPLAPGGWSHPIQMPGLHDR